MTTNALDHARRFSFFQLVHLIERESKGSAALLGTAGPSWSESLRLRPEATLGSPTTQVSALERTGADSTSRYLLTTTDVGLYGANSPLPLHYTQRTFPEQLDVAFELRQPNPVRDFLDVFNHRLLSLLYRAWLRARPEAQCELDPALAPSDYMFALLGFDTAEALAQLCPRAGRRLLAYAGLFMQKPRSADSLERLLSGYFAVRVRVEQCLGRWVNVSLAQRITLGGDNARLGDDAVIGARAHLRDRVRMVIGPLLLRQFVAFLPGREAFVELKTIVRTFVREPVPCDATLLMRECEAPGLMLSATPNDETPMLLGFTTWLRTPHGRDDRDDSFVSVTLPVIQMGGVS